MCIITRADEAAPWKPPSLVQRGSRHRYMITLTINYWKTEEGLLLTYQSGGPSGNYDGRS